MTSTRKRQGIELGYDAFLDIVANLVGILIILVVVLGAQSTSKIEDIKKQSEEQRKNIATQKQITELTKKTQQAIAAQADSDRFEKLIGQQKIQIRQIKAERDLLLDILDQAETAWQESQSKLDSLKIEAAQQLITYQQKQDLVKELSIEAERLSKQEDQVTEIQHLPTPMAKTVFGEEIHFRLKDNRLSVVPIEPLLNAIKQDFERASIGSRVGRQISSVGPIRGYVAKYELDKEKGTINRGGQIQTATRIQLVNLSIEPLEDPSGTPVREVLENGHQLDIELAGRDPGSTTITIWVYPESFQSFRLIKQILYERGFATAARPLPLGHVISGGPNGSRSQAQ